MKTIQQVLTLTTAFLEKKGMPNSRRQAEELISSALQMPRLDLYLAFDQPLQDEELERCRIFLQRRAKGEPLAYIEQESEFYGCRIRLGPQVLIPRQETELLVDLIAKQLKSTDLKGRVLWDICCGSGCIGISLKKCFPDLRVICSDISPEALQMAQLNAQMNGVDVEFRKGDLLAPFQGEKADFVVSNPPYVSEAEYEELEGDVRHFEPRLALVAGPLGSEFYAHLASNLKKYLYPHARVWLEIGYRQGQEVDRLFSQAGWRKRALQRDFSGQERFFSLENE